jgi:hypothetical protein
MIGIESTAGERIAMAREIAEGRRRQFQRHRSQAKPTAYEAPRATRATRPRVRSASRA